MTRENGFYWVRYLTYRKTRAIVEVAEWFEDHWLLPGSDNYFGPDWRELDGFEVISPRLEPPRHCPHERLNMDGICLSCGADCRRGS